MATWLEFSAAAPELAEAIEARLKAHKHHLLATLRKDGSPRLSGTEVEIFDGKLVIGSMPGAMKVRDLLRDPRYALHSNPGDHTMTGGDAKLSGHAREATGEERDWIVAAYADKYGGETAAGDDGAHMVVLDVDEATHITVDDKHLYVDLWRPGREVERFVK
ncbi:pyridoxamine 5'-phosphate oxidase family protein [Aldersonia kunmingensis]|uniref:pyridoxamine 5'-phosphate oxidase family protein n=1 Tax=Aldersonia kunmingensis TaxID=408066 RepID=UPI0008324A4D|nr:pyridoxamine 5'-phosphate oxidase family protein [Aldersonia kunmingensis]